MAPILSFRRFLRESAGRLPTNPGDIDPNQRIDLGVIYRGVESICNVRHVESDPVSTLRVCKGGDLGDGIYFTQDLKLAQSYGGGPSATIKNGGRKVFSYRLPQIYPDQVAFLFGGAKSGQGVEIWSGTGILIWQGPWNVEQIESVCHHEAFDLVIGAPGSIGQNQICVRNKTIIRPVGLTEAIKDYKASWSSTFNKGMDGPDRSHPLDSRGSWLHHRRKTHLFPDPFYPEGLEGVTETAQRVGCGYC